MTERPHPEPVETAHDGSNEAHPADPEAVERARDQEERLGSAPSTTSDRSLTGETRPVDAPEVSGTTVPLAEGADEGEDGAGGTDG